MELKIVDKAEQAAAGRGMEIVGSTFNHLHILQGEQGRQELAEGCDRIRHRPVLAGAVGR